jgi:hypothetical protein
MHDLAPQRTVGREAPVAENLLSPRAPGTKARSIQDAHARASRRQIKRDWKKREKYSSWINHEIDKVLEKNPKRDQ